MRGSPQEVVMKKTYSTPSVECHGEVVGATMNSNISPVESGASNFALRTPASVGQVGFSL
jgi:hypothetical protein